MCSPRLTERGLSGSSCPSAPEGRYTVPLLPAGAPGVRTDDRSPQPEGRVQSSVSSVGDSTGGPSGLDFSERG